MEGCQHTPPKYPECPNSEGGTTCTSPHYPGHTSSEGGTNSASSSHCATVPPPTVNTTLPELTKPDDDDTTIPTSSHTKQHSKPRKHKGRQHPPSTIQTQSATQSRHSRCNQTALALAANTCPTPLPHQALHGNAFNCVVQTMPGTF